MLLKVYNQALDFLPAKTAALLPATVTLPGGVGQQVAPGFEAPYGDAGQPYSRLTLVALSNRAAAEGRAFTLAVEDEDGRVYAQFEAEAVGDPGTDFLRVAETLTVFPPEGVIRLTNGGAEAHTIDLTWGWA
ncbi:MAG: hypothetical protein CMLOHMNK_02038 [Steroidobacteraceae bacterium]|nr:hypothetical protein [Steroidobacteraceae bacterium]